MPDRPEAEIPSAAEAGAEAAWAAMCERTPGTTRDPGEALEWMQAVEQILADALPALHASWREKLLGEEAVEAADRAAGRWLSSGKAGVKAVEAALDTALATKEGRDGDERG